MADGGGAGLWKDRNFRVFLTAQTLSALGDSFSFVAIPLPVLQATGSVVQMGVVTGLAGVGSAAQRGLPLDP